MPAEGGDAALLKAKIALSAVPLVKQIPRSLNSYAVPPHRRGYTRVIMYRVSASLVFKTSTLDRSVTPPR